MAFAQATVDSPFVQRDLNRGLQIPFGERLDQVTVGLNFFGPIECFVIGVGGEKYDWHVTRLAYPSSRFDAVHRPVDPHVHQDEVRDRLAEIPKDRLILVYCLTGIRSYYVCRILTQLGYTAKNLSGGYTVYCAACPTKCKGIPGLHRWNLALALDTFCSTPEERKIIRNKN